MVKTILWDDAFEWYLRDEFDLVMPFSSPYEYDFVTYLQENGLEVIKYDTGE